MLGLHVAANEEARASDRSYAYARGRNAYFRNDLTSKRRTYFRLAGQLSQLCRQTLHFFAYYPRTIAESILASGYSSMLHGLSHLGPTDSRA